MIDVPLEDDEQAAFVAWLEARGYKFTAIPNSTFTKSFKVKKRNHRLGLRPGLPDLFIIAEGKAMFVEMKRLTGSSTSQAQHSWIAALTAAKVPAAVCKGSAAAIQFVQDTLRPSDMWPEQGGRVSCGAHGVDVLGKPKFDYTCDECVLPPNHKDPF